LARNRDIVSFIEKSYVSFAGIVLPYNQRLEIKAGCFFSTKLSNADVRKA
jgi:hypothetical protein